MATMSPLLIPTDAAPALVTPPRSLCIAFRRRQGTAARRRRPARQRGRHPPPPCDGGELAQVKRDLRNAMRRADRAESRGRGEQGSGAQPRDDVHGATRRERERRAEAARAAEARAARARALRYTRSRSFLGL